MDERALAYKKLRAAAHRLLCKTRERTRGAGVIVNEGALEALSRALDAADALENVVDSSQGKPQGTDH